MSKETKKPKAKAKSKKPADMHTEMLNDRTVLGQKVKGATPNRRIYSDDIRAAAKALWEGSASKSKRQVAEEMRIPFGTIDRWSKGDEGKSTRWVKRRENMSEEAQAAADRYKLKLSELGPEITMEQQQQAMDDTAIDAGIEMRARILERHRKEWNVPRKLSYDAVKTKNFNEMKMAKITSEMLKIVQDGERKAWGLDSGPDGSTKLQIVIERE